MALRDIIEIDYDVCDACGMCIPSCMENALTIENNKLIIKEDKLCDGLGACIGNCPKNALKIIQRDADDFDISAVHKEKSCASLESFSTHNQTNKLKSTWPVKLSLISPKVDFLQNASLCFVADCAGYACHSLHKKINDKEIVLISCPRLEEKNSLIEKISILLAQAQTISIIRMEVPCCVLPELVEKAQLKAGTNFKVTVHVLTRDGKEYMGTMLGKK